MENQWIKIAKEWTTIDPNEETRNEILNDIANKDFATLEGKLGSRLEFGTAGLRGAMGAGSCFMNDLVIIQTTQGLVRYLEEIFGNKVKEMGVAVGYDHRKKGSLTSKHFAELVCVVCAARSIKTFLFSTPVATPLVPWCVEEMKCAAGIMITASHNPKEDNGYKLYWNNGSQIIPPHDKNIANLILSNLIPWPLDLSNCKPNEELTLKLGTKYFESLAKKLCRHRQDNKVSTLKIAYTAMHGVGNAWLSKAFEAFGLPPYIPVMAQLHPDPEFPTVAFPNPEEGQGALELAIQLANKENCHIILANDPDADRLAVAEKGNDGYWEWKCLIKQDPHINKKDVYVIASTVSSKALRQMADQEGFSFKETLTGFKWMGNVTDTLRKEGKRVIFSFEEAIGFCCGDVVKDKDGISAGAVFAEMANQLYKSGTTCAEHLEFLYNTYGQFVAQNYYVKCYSPSTIQRIFERLRNGGKYWERCGEYEIAFIRDLTTGFDNSKPNNKADLPVSKSTQMITYTFKNGCVATLRTSGTEPKLKYYVELPGKIGEKREELQATVSSMVKCIIEEMLQPQLNDIQL